MKQRTLFKYALALALIYGVPTAIAQEERPTVLSCAENAYAVRDFGFREQRWMSGAGDEGAAFRVVIRETAQPSRCEMLFFYDRVFAGLDTPTPTVRSTRYMLMSDNYEELQTVEFTGRVVSRTKDSVFVTWANDFGNKVWLAVVDLRHRKVAMAIAFEGVTSTGVRANTFDCR